MQHAVLYGEHELTIDPKNRLLVPSEIRRFLDPQRDGIAFFIVIGKNRKPWFFTEKFYEFLATQGRQELTPDEDVLAFNQYHYSRASRAEWDKQGRILLPEKTLRRTGTGKEVTLIGAKDHLELWNRSEWDARFEDLTARAGEIEQRAKQANQQV